MSTSSHNDDGSIFVLLALCFIFLATLIGWICWTNWRYKEVVDCVATITVEVTHIYPPKHVYVDLRQPDTGATWTKVYVSKHYNDWRDVQYYKPFQVERVFYRTPNAANPDQLYVRFAYGSVLAGVQSITK